MIAQDVEKEFPQAVYKNKKTGFLSVNYSGLIGPLIEATKEIDHNLKMFKTMQEGIDNEQNRRISSLEEEVKELREIKEKYKSLKEYLCTKDPAAPFCRERGASRLIQMNY